jgi:hypothetical protein
VRAGGIQFGRQRKAAAAVRRVETDRLWPGAVVAALGTYRRFVHRPGRYLTIPNAYCPCCDPVDARGTLDLVLRLLPARDRGEPRRVVEPLDAEFERRTLPDPFATAPEWWQCRVREM